MTRLMIQAEFDGLAASAAVPLTARCPVADVLTVGPDNRGERRP